MSAAVLRFDQDLGRIFVPKEFEKAISLPGSASRRKVGKEIGIFVATQKRRLNRLGDAWQPGDLENGDHGVLETLWASITHNERVDVGAAFQKNKTFVSATGVATSVAVANGTLSKSKLDQSLGSNSADVSTNEHTGFGLARATGTVQNYVLPASLGGQFSIDIFKAFTATGGATAYGAALLNSNTVVGSLLYAEDNFASTAVLVLNDILNVTVTVTN